MVGLKPTRGRRVDPFRGRDRPSCLSVPVRPPTCLTRPGPVRVTSRRSVVSGNVRSDWGLGDSCLNREGFDYGPETVLEECQSDCVLPASLSGVPPLLYPPRESRTGDRRRGGTVGSGQRRRHCGTRALSDTDLEDGGAGTTRRSMRVPSETDGHGVDTLSCPEDGGLCTSSWLGAGTTHRN